VAGADGVVLLESLLVVPPFSYERGFSGARLTERRVMVDDVPLPVAVGVALSSEAARGTRARGTRLKRMLWPVT
jgi:hypothetical protein